MPRVIYVCDFLSSRNQKNPVLSLNCSLCVICPCCHTLCTYVVIGGISFARLWFEVVHLKLTIHTVSPEAVLLVSIPNTICYLKKIYRRKNKWKEEEEEKEAGEVGPCVAPYPGPTAFHITSFQASCLSSAIFFSSTLNMGATISTCWGALPSTAELFPPTPTVYTSVLCCFQYFPLVRTLKP